MAKQSTKSAPKKSAAPKAAPKSASKAAPKSTAKAAAKSTAKAAAKPAAKAAPKAPSSKAAPAKKDSVRKQTTDMMSSMADKAVKAGKATVKEIKSLAGSMLGQNEAKGKRKK